jgi:2-keto-3-deoxy-L-rhamnonate aldolase RhmA
MRPNVLAEKLRAGKVVLGLNNMYPASGIIESMCRGWDFVWIDGQHGQHTYDSLLHAVQAAAATDVESFVRVPGHEHGFLGPIADLAPSAIMVPMVDTVEQARWVVSGLRFPPLGIRSYGGRRVIDLDGREYYRERELLVITQVETLEGARNAAAVAATPGVDGLFFGPDDMKVRMGLPIDLQITESEELRRAMETTAQAARKAGKFCGCVAATPTALRMAIDLGYQLIACGSDVMFIRATSAAKLKELRAVIDAAPAQAPESPKSAVY